MDCLILFCSLKLLDLWVPLYRVVFAAASSAIGSVFLLKMQLTNIGAFLFRVLLYAVLIVMTVSPKEKQICLRFAGTVFLLAALCGGLSLSMACVTSGRTYVGNGQMLMLHLPSYLLPCAVCMLILSVIFIKKRLEDRKILQNTAQVEIRIKDHTFSCVGYFDSGNLHQHNGCSVIVVCTSVLEDFFEKMPQNGLDFLQNHAPRLGLSDRVGVIPIQTVGGGNLLASMRPDDVLIDGLSVRAVIALSFEQLDGADRFRALLPANIKKKV